MCRPRGKGRRVCLARIVWDSEEIFTCMCRHVHAYRQPSCSKLKSESKLFRNSNFSSWLISQAFYQHMLSISEVLKA